MTEIMLNQIFSKLLKLEQNDAKVQKIKDEAINKVNSTTAVLEKQGQLQRIVIMKTTTFYLAQALGVLR